MNPRVSSGTPTLAADFKGCDEAELRYLGGQLACRIPSLKDDRISKQMGTDERRDVKPLLSKEWLGTHPPDVLRLNPLATPSPWPCTLACRTL